MRRSSNRRGSNAIEFALTLPVFVILLSGVIDFSWYFFAGWRVSSAVREGIRVGSKTPMSAGPAAVAASVADDAGVAYSLDWTAGYPVATVIGSAGDFSCGISVEGRADVEPLIGIVPKYVQNWTVPSLMQYKAVMRLEDQSC